MVQIKMIFTSKNSLRIASIFCLLGVVFLPIWRPMFTFFPIKLSDLFFLCAVIMWISDPASMLQFPKKLMLSMFAISCSLVIAMLWGYFRFDLPLISLNSAVLVIRLLFNFGLCLMILDLKRNNVEFEVQLLYGVMSAVFLILLLNYNEFYDSDRFMGLTLNPNTAGFGFLMAFIVATGLSCSMYQSKRPMLSVILLLMGIVLFVLIAYTKGRGLIGVAALSPILTLIYLRAIKVQTFIIICGLIMLFGITVVLTMPASWQNYLGLMLFRPRDGYYFGFWPMLKQFLTVPYYNPRLSSLLYYWELCEQSNFIGLGLNFEAKFLAPWHGEWHGPNSIIDLIVYGGFPLILSVIYMFRILDQAQSWVSTDANRIAFLGLLLLYIIAIFMGTNIFSYYHWILLGVAYPTVSISENRKNFGPELLCARQI